LSPGVALGVLAKHGLSDPSPVFPVFESAASSKAFDIREMAQMFFRGLIGKHAGEVKVFLMRLVRSDEDKTRRFVAETLRPVVENRWFYDDPDYPLSILRHLFKESARYPRASVGNNLSDLSRRLPDLVFELAEELVSSGDPNSYWIAYRACRNLVKKHPLRVMDVLKIDEYRYKKRVHRRSDYGRDQG
jgi:3-methyladenine DNA glycosylase AlkC